MAFRKADVDRGLASASAGLRSRPPMRPLPSRSVVLALVVAPAVAIAAACGGSTTSNPPAADSGAPPQDGSADTGIAMDASSVDTGALVDSGVADSGVVVDSGVVGDGGACPAVTGSVTEAAHGKPPVVSNLGGPVLHSPTVVTFTFQDTANAAALQAFGASIGSTSWFGEVLGDYTTTTSTPAGLSVAIAANADVTYVDNGAVGGDAGTGSGTDLNGFMNQAIANAVTAGTIPAPDGNTVYMFYFPSTTTITGFVGQSCQDYGGYHFNQVYVDGTTPIYYAVLPDCAAGSSYELEASTITASHELIEATSDPAPNTGWSLDTSPYPEAERRRSSTATIRGSPWATARSLTTAWERRGPSTAAPWCSASGRTRPRRAATIRASRSRPARRTSTPRPTRPSTWPTWATPSR